MRGYKVFNNDWTCKDFQYAVGETYEIKEVPICCKKGFHFCKNLSDCFRYYDFDPNNKVAEVEALGNIVSDADKKYCTNKIHIVRELSWHEVIDLVNTGDNNTGMRNTGDCNTGNNNNGNRNTGIGNTGDNNTGNRNTGTGNTGNNNTGSLNTGNRNTGTGNTGNNNTGSWNTGNGNKSYGNTGNFNTGSWNTGNNNTGDYNTGILNTGDRNTGYNNVGYYNSGNWNIGSYNTGCFNISYHNTGCFNRDNHNIIAFDAPTNLTCNEYMRLDGMHILTNYPDKIEFIDECDMSDIEKEEHPEYKTIGGYLKEYYNGEFKTIVQKWWDNLSDTDKQSVMDLPNFDPDIFYDCTWIKVN